MNRFENLYFPHKWEGSFNSAVSGMLLDTTLSSIQYAIIGLMLSKNRQMVGQGHVLTIKKLYDLWAMLFHSHAN